MVAMLAFGGTFAYFTASANSKSVNVTTGKIQLKSGEAVSQTITGAVTNTPVLGAVTFDKGETNVHTYFFVKLTIDGSVTPAQLFGSDITVNSAWTPVSITGLDAKTKVYVQEYMEGEAGEEDTDFTGEFIDALTITQGANWDEEDQEKPAIMGETFTISLAARGIQGYGLGSAAEAYSKVSW